MNGVRPFLRAEWRHLAILNFVVEPSVLEPILPRGLELDRWEDRHYVSLIGFQFLHLRILGMPVPCHRSFDEVNLRFYVRRKAPDGWRHGAVFIKELVSHRAIPSGLAPYSTSRVPRCRCGIVSKTRRPTAGSSNR